VTPRHVGCQDGSCKGLPLDSDHKFTVGASKVDSELKSPDAGAQRCDA
jgi:hypothetical protein